MWGKVLNKIIYIVMQEGIVMEINFGGVMVENIMCIKMYEVRVRYGINCYVGNYVYFQFKLYVGFNYVSIGCGEDDMWC